MGLTGAQIRKSIEQKWNEYLSRYGNLFSSNFLSGSSPPSVFVGTYGYPKVGVGPMVPPFDGNTSILDLPEKWHGRTLEEIVNFRLNLVRGVNTVSSLKPTGRYIEDLQELAMAENTPHSEITFEKNTVPVSTIDGQSPPFGPVGQIKNAKFFDMKTNQSIQKAYYDKDLRAEDAVVFLYNCGVEISRIQKCFSIGMFGKNRKLVPTKWSITATDDIISKNHVTQILDYPQLDTYFVFTHQHLGNIYSVLLFPHRWMFEMVEAWHTAGGEIGFGADAEDARGLDHYPQIAGAYFAAKLGVTEYLKKIRRQCGVIILREIKAEYAVPVGVWQVREAIRAAMTKKPVILESLGGALNAACLHMSVSRSEWESHGITMKMLKQKSITEYF